MKLLKLIPSSVRTKIFGIFKAHLKVALKQSTSLIPKYELEWKHLANARLLVNREELLKLLPKSGVVAELGVDEGNFSELILRSCAPIKLHLIDYWGTKRFDQNKRLKVENRFSAEIGQKQVEIHVGFSTVVVNDFPDSYFDWIYLDTLHSYTQVIAELEAYKSKVKDNGVIAGHDFVMGNWNEMTRYGVIEAVYEFCVKHDWEIIYITSENKYNASFAIRKIVPGNLGSL